MTHILALCGGVGGAKLAHGLSACLPPEELCILTNTGDDFVHLGLHISPDIDSVAYALAGLSDPVRGWGRRDESWQFMAALGQLGGEDWFNLGDRDLATHVLRTQYIAGGDTLTKATQRLTCAMGIAHNIVPMSDDAVRTQLLTKDGWLDFQDYFVREQCQPTVADIRFQGAQQASVNPLALDFKDNGASVAVLIMPSNPLLSIDPILALSDINNLLTGRRVIAISPLIGEGAIKGPTAKLMRELGLPCNALGIAMHYQTRIDTLIIDEKDTALRTDIEALGIEVQCANILMRNHTERTQLAQYCLSILSS
jgi:LPPG:FO 2-phospho-L-lactate transferase